MNSLSILTGQPRLMTIDGERYEIHPLNLGDFGQLQAWVDAQAVDPFDIANEEIDKRKYPVAQQKYLLEIAMNLRSRGTPQLGTPEADAKLYSHQGLKQILWHSVRKGRPDFTLAQAEALFNRLTVGDLTRMIQDTNVNMVADAPGDGDDEKKA